MASWRRSAGVFAAAAVALALLALAAAAILRLGRVDDVSRQWMESRALGIARVVAGASQAALDLDDRVAAASALEALSGTPDAAYAVVVDADGHALASWGKVPKVSPADAAPASYAGGLLHVQVPIAARAGRSGTLRLGFGLDELARRVREARALVGWLLAATLGLGVALTVSLGLARRVRERTRDLARTNAALEALRRAQEQLVVADRRVSLGRLAAGVGHEINNPLAFVSANIGWVRDALDGLRMRIGASGPPPAAELRAVVEGAREALADAAEGAERVRHIVRQLKTFSRSADEERRAPMPVGAAVDVAVEMAAHEVKHRARLVRIDEPAPLVLANPVRLAQVLLNLLVNAAQAIPEGAATRNEIRVRVGTGPAGEAVVSIEDTGAGIAPDVLPRLFHPFFTTKAAGLGTGLGLSISQGIVKDLGGEISVESAVGRGSTFTVRLPACDLALAPMAGVDELEPLRTPPPRVRKERRVLVVEDEPLVAAALARVLSLTHDVEVATSGRDAIARVEAGARYDRILCDLMMPDASGVDVHEALARLAPQQASRLVFMSGGAFTERTRAFLETWHGPFLEKPVDLAVLRRVLDAA